MNVTLLIINNYIHDLATGFFFATTVIAYLLVKKVDLKETTTRQSLIRMLEKISLASFVAIFPFGLIRLAFFYKIEMKPYADISMTEALIAKHLVLFALTFSGVYLWLKVSKEKK